MNKDLILKMEEDLKKEFTSDINLEKLNELKILYLGKTGKITELSKEIKNVANEDKKEFGMLINDVRNLFNSLYEEKLKVLELEKLNKKLESEKIDISLPATNINIGAPNILERIIEEVEELLMSMGYDVVDGPEVEQDLYNFEKLNLPQFTLGNLILKAPTAGVASISNLLYALN